MGPEKHPLDIDWLEDFIALSETGNFSRAAEVRAIAQPALSRHIRALEEWVGVDLIDRSAHPMELTAAGARLRPLVQGILASLQAARIKAKAAHDQANASLRFAVTHSLSLTFFPRWLSRLDGTLRLGPVQTMSDTFKGCDELMGQRRVQFLLCYAHAGVPTRLDDEQYPVINLGTDVLVPVTRAQRPDDGLWALNAAGPLPILDYGDASALGRILQVTLRAAFRKAPASAHGQAVSVVFTAHNALLLKALALEGRGIAWIPRSLVSEELTQGALHLAGDADWQVPIEIRLYRQKSDMSPAAETFWQTASPAV